MTEDTVGQTVWDEGLQASPVTEDPEADGAFDAVPPSHVEAMDLPPVGTVAALDG